MKSKVWLGLLFLFLFVGIGAAAIWLVPKIYTAIAPVGENANPADSAEESFFVEPAYTDIDIACVGDILIHNTVFWAAQTGSEYDFRPQFVYVKPLLAQADLTIANLETTLAGPEQKYSGYPQFNCPDAIVDALKDAGVDVLTNANNHCIDKGAAGFFRTIDTVRQRGLDLIGTRKTEQEPPYLIKTVKDVKIGIVNFGYGTYTNNKLQINGLLMPPSMENLLNYLDYSRLGSEVAKLRNTLEAARQDGAEVLVVCMHWGNEYQTHSDSLQRQVAQELADLNVDIVFGGHPHVLQEADTVSSKDGSHQTLVYYSLGNFISDQRLETVNNINTEHGMIAQVTLRHHTDGRNEILHKGYTSTWVNKKKGTKTLYEVIPVAQALDQITGFPNLVPNDLPRLLSCQKSVDELMVAIRTK